jgi:DNA-binding transcriptional ArsR family regulator
MKVKDFTRTPQRLAVEVDWGISYELLMSLIKFSMRESEATFDDGREWFEKVRTRVSPALRRSLDRLGPGTNPWGALVRLIRQDPVARDAIRLVERVEATSPLEVRLNLLWYYAPWNRGVIDLEQIRAAAEGHPAAQDALLANPLYLKDDPPSSLRQLMALDPSATKDTVVDILRRWHAEVFADDEDELAAVLHRDAEAKRALAAAAAPDDLIERATNGLEYSSQPWIGRVLLIPHVTMRPWNVMNGYDDVSVFCYPVADESLGVDVTAPPARLVRLHKALGDEKRLRILKRLAHSSATLQELADEVGLAKSSTHHHLVILRSAGLARVTLEENSRYTLRREFIPEASGWLQGFLERGEP